MVNRHHTDLVVLERLVVLARRRFALLPVGVSFMEVSRVFRRMMHDALAALYAAKYACAGAGVGAPYGLSSCVRVSDRDCAALG